MWDELNKKGTVKQTVFSNFFGHRNRTRNLGSQNTRLLELTGRSFGAGAHFNNNPQ